MDNSLIDHTSSCKVFQNKLQTQHSDSKINSAESHQPSRRLRPICLLVCCRVAPNPTNKLHNFNRIQQKICRFPGTNRRQAAVIVANLFGFARGGRKKWAEGGKEVGGNPPDSIKNTPSPLHSPDHPNPSAKTCSLLARGLQFQRCRGRGGGERENVNLGQQHLEVNSSFCNQKTNSGRRKGTWRVIICLCSSVKVEKISHTLFLLKLVYVFSEFHSFAF